MEAASSVLPPAWTALSLFAAAAALLVAACGEGGVAGDDLSGSVAIDGSSTVFPITEAVSEEFQLLHRRVRVTVGVSGTGGGFQKFCSGDVDISGASRPITDSEREACADEGIEWLELVVGLDGLAVVTNPGNDFLDRITLEQLRTIWEPAAEGTITRWSQVNPAWPDEKIELFGPGVDSGTFDFFTERIVGESKASRGDFTASEDDNFLVVGVAGEKYSLSYFGFAYFSENADKLKVLPVEGVVPSDATVAGGSYPLARPLFIYVDRESLGAKPQVREYVRYFLSDEAMTLVPDVGYTAIPEARLVEARAALEAAIADAEAARVGS